MSDTHRMVEIVCDGDRWPNAARELLTIEHCNWIREQAQRVSVWAFLERMSSVCGRYHAGYLQALEDMLSFLEGGEQGQ
jgi:hypothetical protein